MAARALGRRGGFQPPLRRNMAGSLFWPALYYYRCKVNVSRAGHPMAAFSLFSAGWFSLRLLYRDMRLRPACFGEQAFHTVGGRRRRSWFLARFRLFLLKEGAVSAFSTSLSACRCTGASTWPLSQTQQTAVVRLLGCIPWLLASVRWRAAFANRVRCCAHNRR